MTGDTKILRRSRYEALRAKGEIPYDLLVVEDQPSPEMVALIRQCKMTIYMTWLDEPSPDLGFWTPRQAAADSAEGLAAVESLVLEMEEWDHQMPAEEQFDFSVVRRELGIGLVGDWNVYELGG